MNFAPYSISKIQLYNNCPRAFKFRYIQKIPEEDKQCFKKGREIHKILETYPTSKSNQIIEKFLRSDLGRKYEYFIKESRKCSKEVKIAFTKNLEKTTFGSKTAFFRGIVDLIFIKDNILYLCDYKTGKAKDFQTQDFSQLIYYAVYFFMQYKYLEKIRLSFIYVEHNVENELELSRESYEIYLKKLKMNIEKIEQDSEFNPSKSWRCEFCSFKKRCSELA